MIKCQCWKVTYSPRAKEKHRSGYSISEGVMHNPISIEGEGWVLRNAEKQVRVGEQGFPIIYIYLKLFDRSEVTTFFMFIMLFILLSFPTKIYFTICNQISFILLIFTGSQWSASPQVWRVFLSLCWAWVTISVTLCKRQHCWLQFQISWSLTQGNAWSLLTWCEGAW